MKDLKNLIIELRGEKVILDFNLAKLYGVNARALRQAVKRNINRFPRDFMFILTEEEVIHMVSQFVTPSYSFLGGSLPMAFTESGVAMLSSVLRSEKAVQVNIMIIRIFVMMRKTLATNSELSLKISAIEEELSSHSDQLKILFQQLDNLTKEDPSPNDKIGFKLD